MNMLYECKYGIKNFKVFDNIQAKSNKKFEFQQNQIEKTTSLLINDKLPLIKESHEKKNNN